MEKKNLTKCNTSDLPTFFHDPTAVGGSTVLSPGFRGKEIETEREPGSPVGSIASSRGRTRSTSKGLRFLETSKTSILCHQRVFSFLLSLTTF